MLVEKLQPQPIDCKAVERKDKATKKSYKFFCDRRHSVHALPELQPGEEVLLKLDNDRHWKTPALVLNKASEPQSHRVKTQNGSILCRDRKHLLVKPKQTASYSIHQYISNTLLENHLESCKILSVS